MGDFRSWFIQLLIKVVLFEEKSIIIGAFGYLTHIKTCYAHFMIPVHILNSVVDTINLSKIAELGPIEGE